MRIPKSHQYEIGKEFKVSSPCGYLAVACISRDARRDRYGFRWRFESDTAWMQVEVDGGTDVIDDICDTAADTYQRTGRHRQAEDHPQYIRESMEKIAAEMCLHCHAGMSTPGHAATTGIGGGRLFTCHCGGPHFALNCAIAAVPLMRDIEQDRREIARKHQAFANFKMAQREDANPNAMKPEDRAAASAQWSAQLRIKIAEQKERDAEAARYTPWWSPEEQQGGDL